jgi:beta-galactosidase
MQNNITRMLSIIVVCIGLTNCHKKKEVSPFEKETGYVKRNAKQFFYKPDLMIFGVYYYPEQWPKEQWQRDLHNIKKLGFEFTHFAEFSWALLEPKEGVYNFKWLDEAMELAEKEGLKVILCTPSACPPAWMSEKYPEIYLVDESGRRREHGNRGNQSLSNAIYKKYVDKLVIKLGRRYGRNKNVMGWQLDNEPGASYDYSPSARQAFQGWLQNKYQTIENLNKEWVGSFWSTQYDNFEQIVIPNISLYSEDKLSPHAVLDFSRFTADAQAGFLNRQADLLRKYTGSWQWITTNYTNVVYNADPRRTTHLDFPTYTMYPVSGRNPLGGNSFRTGSPYKIAEANDYYRSMNGVTAVMELQPGQVNWAPVNPQLLPGTVHMWLMQAFGGGCAFACTYRYRHPLGSSEMYHDGIVGTDGVTLSRGGEEFVTAMKEMKQLRKCYDSTIHMPEKLIKIKTAFLWDHENLWDLENQKQTTAWNTWQHRNVYTAAVKSTGAPMDFISADADFSEYPFLIASAYQLIDQKLVDKWKQYVINGGHLILSCRTGQKDKNGHFFEGKWSQPITSLIGAKIEFFDMLVPDVHGKIQAGANIYEWNSWADVLTPDPDTKVLATYADQFYKGKAAVVTRHVGKGTITYLGAASTDGNLEREIVRKVYSDAGVEMENFLKGVMVEWRDGFYVGVNYTDNPISLPVPENSKILVGTNPVQPAQAIIWK